MLQAGNPGAARSRGGLRDGPAPATQRVWLAVAVASGRPKTRSPADLPAWAASCSRRVAVRPALAASASPITRASAPDFNASSMVHNKAMGFLSVTVTKRWRESPKRSSPWP